MAELAKTELLVAFPTKVIKAERGTPVSVFSEYLGANESNVLAVRINNEVCPLDMPLEVNCTVEPVLNNTTDGERVYRRSVCLLLAAAAHSIYPEARLLCGHSLGGGYYYTLQTNTAFDCPHVFELEKQMWLLIEEGVDFQSNLISYSDAVTLFDKLGLKQTKEHLKYTCPSSVVVNAVVKANEVIFSDISFGPLVPSSKYITAFALLPYGKGFVLRFPKMNKPEVLPPFREQPKLFNVYCKYKEWGKRVGVTNVASLNALVAQRGIDDFIEICETFQQRQFADVADQIVRKGDVRVVLLAGPSSSGKTTSAKKLSLELEAIGYRPKVISLDCYYVGHDKTPRGKDGKPDFECLEALDVPLINDNLLDLFAGKEVVIPSYDFATGSRYFDDKTRMHLEKNDILIMEGIHALNDRLTERIEHKLKFRLYLSALTQINLDDHNRISTSDNRLIRRIVRDSQFRHKDAAGTIAMWPSVQKGEKLHIFPFQNDADAFINTALDYELSVLKVYAVPLLRCVAPTKREYSEARRLLSFLGNFAEIDSEAVPKRSILREFIGGSAFHY